MKHANVAVFIPHNGCPHQCSFCDQRGITGKADQPTPDDVKGAVETALRSGCDPAQTEIAFFGGSFTAVDRRYMLSLLDAAFPYVGTGGFSGIRISTRPDAVEPEILEILKARRVTAVELGAQSMDDRVLAMNGRGHSSVQVAQAAGRIRAYGFSLGLQMMTGLYGDTPAGALETARRLAALKPDTVRIYPAIVLRDTELGGLYEKGEYQPPALQDTVALCAALLDFFKENGIRVIRLGLHASPDLEKKMLAGPWHPAFGELCRSALFLRRLEKALQKHAVTPGRLTVFIAPADVSQVQGQKKCNLFQLQSLGYTVDFVQLASIPRGTFRFYDAKLEHNVDFVW